ncbi:MAG: glycosyl hydrolase [Bacteroidota bacterium]|nr:glycosyl hydrolase [Bacteroidota bacterium]
MIKVSNLFILLLFFNFSFAQKKSKKNNFPKSTSAIERFSSNDKNLNDNKSLLKNINFRNIGPTVMSGRVVDLDINPEDPTHFYVAYASGGLWETRNHGNTFSPLFDNQMVMTIGDIKVDWKENIIYVGTGENNSSRSSYSGNGIYNSDDNGKNWTHIGLDDSHHIGRIIIHPNNSKVLWVAALGHLYSKNIERGVYKSITGGETWKKTLYVNDLTGAIDLIIDESNPNILYASMWEKDRKAWNFDGAGLGSGIYKSTDGGSTWLEISGGSSGFPDTEGTGRIGLDISRSNPNILYAILDNQDRKENEEVNVNHDLTKGQLRDISVENFLKISNKKINKFLRDNRFPSKYSVSVIRSMIKNGDILPYSLVEYLEDSNTLLYDTPVIGAEVYMSENYGNTWKKVNEDDLFNLFYSYGYYFGEIRVDPQNPAKVYTMGVPIVKSNDYGKTWESIDYENMHGDFHALWLNPNRTGHLIVGNDGGVNISYDDGDNWMKYNSPSVGQFYDINIDMKKPYNVYGGFQDNGVWMGPSNYTSSLRWHSSGKYPWKSIYGGDGMQTEIDFRDNETVYTGSQFGNYSRVNTRTGERKRITPSHKLGERPYRWNWETPIYLSRHNQDILYMGSNKFHRSLNQGDNFETLSNDLTNGGIQGNVSYGSLTTIIESDLKFGLIYVGSDDGLVHVSKDGGVSWNNISSSLPNDMWVSGIFPSKFKQSRVYLALNGYRWDDFSPMVYVSEDYGLNWSKIGHNLPMEPVNVIIEDNENESLIYVGTDHGVYASLDFGNTFSPFSKGLSGAPVHDLVVHPRDNDLVVGTHGRSVYIADVSHLQKIDETVLSKSLYVFKNDKIKFSNRWGSKNWSGQTIEPSMQFVIYSDSNQEIDLTITSNDEVIFNEKRKLDYGLNFIENNLYNENEEKYLSKGKYKLKVTNLDDYSITEFEIN